MENNPSNMLDFWSSGYLGQKIKHGHLITVLRNITWLVEIVSVSAKHRSDGNRGRVRRLAAMEMGAWLQWRWVLGCNGDGHLAVMEHEAGIERVTGHRLGSGRKFGLGY